VQQLNVNQSIAFDNEKLHLANPNTSEKFLWKATYESHLSYIKTVEAMYPALIEMIERNLFDFKRYKKWCYFWEGIYLSSTAVKKLHDKYDDNIYYLSIYNLPSMPDIKNQYLLRWQNEFGDRKA